MAKKIVIAAKPDIDQPLSMALLGKYVRHVRTRHGMTLEDCAGFCGLSKQAYNNIEKGLESVKVETLFKALQGLGIELMIEELEDDDEWS